MPPTASLLARLCFSVGVCLGLLTDATAGFSAKMTGADPASTVKVILDSSTLEPGGTFKAGEYDWTRTDSGSQTYSFMTGKTFSTFCIEITQFIKTGTSYNWEVVNLASAPTPGAGQGSNTTAGMGAARANMLQELFEKNYSTLYDGADAAEKNLRAAAFQVAIWEVVFEGPIGASYPSPLKSMEGNFRLDAAYGTIGTKAQAYLDTVTSSGAYGGPQTYLLQAITNGYRQDQLVVSPAFPPGDPPTAVPAPPGLVLALSGLLPGLGLLRPRRRVAA